MKFIDKPQPRTLEDYSSAIDEMTSRIRKLDGVLSIYQIGSVSNSGLSDIDMMVVFEDDTAVAYDPTNNSDCDRYLFTHQIYGVPRSFWEQLRSLTFFHNYRFIEGEQMPELAPELTQKDVLTLKRQIALEFLVKMYIVLAVQFRYKTFKLRTFLLEGKALIYDLEFLNINNGELHHLVKQIIGIRSDWWSKRPSDRELFSLVGKLFDSLTKLLDDELTKQPLALPTKESFSISRNIKFSNGKLDVRSHGMVLPDLGLLDNRKHFKLQNRFNRFEIFCPYSLPEEDSVLAKRFKLLSKLRAYNSRNLPGFLIPASSLKVI